MAGEQAEKLTLPLPPPTAGTASGSPSCRVPAGWKLILYPKAKVAKLYHLTEDPQSTKDLAADPAMAARKKALFAKFQELQQRYDDKLKLDAVFPELK